MAEKYAELPLIARRFLETLDDEKVRSLTQAADLVSDMDADTLGLLRNPKPELIKFLTEVRAPEIEELQNAIELVRAFRRTGRVVRWCLGTVAGAFIATVALWEKISGMVTWLFKTR